MNRAAIALVIAALTLTSACGGSNDTPAARDTPSTSAEPTEPSVSATTDPDPDPAYKVLPEEDLDAALLTIQDLPVGYSQDPPSEASTKTFCDYKPPFTEKLYVSRAFTKGGGISSEILFVGLRQYESADQSLAAFDALTEALSTCQSETYNGTQLEYAAMSAPKVGDDSIGVRITAEDTVLMQNFALVGPTVIATGGGGLINSDAEEIARLLETQVETYQSAAAE